MNLIVKTTVLSATLFMAGTLTAGAVGQSSEVKQDTNTKYSIIGDTILSVDNFVYKFNDEFKAVSTEIATWFDSNTYLVSELSTNTAKFIFNQFSNQMHRSDMQSDRFLSFQNNLFNTANQNLNLMMLSTLNRMEVVDQNILAYFNYSKDQINIQNDMLLISLSSDIKNSNQNIKSNFVALKENSNVLLDNSDIILSDYIIPDLKDSSSKVFQINNYLIASISDQQNKFGRNIDADTTIDSAKILAIEISGLLNSFLDDSAYKIDSVLSLALNSDGGILDKKLPIAFSSNASYLHEAILASNNQDYYFAGKVLGVNTESKLVDKLVANIFGNSLTNNLLINY